MEVLSCIERALQGMRLASNSVKLVAASKKQSQIDIQLYLQLASQLGIEPIIGESYVQEYRAKRDFLPSHSAHLIGQLQRTKVREAVKLFDLIESVHSEEIALEIDKEAKRISKIQPILIQVNVSDDPNKSGFDLNSARKFILEGLPKLGSLKFEGLMTITKLYERPELARNDFRRLKNFGDSLKDEPHIPRLPVLQLSMGMSADYQVAIEEGATIVRLGSAIFGERG